MSESQEYTIIFQLRNPSSPQIAPSVSIESTGIANVSALAMSSDPSAAPLLVTTASEFLSISFNPAKAGTHTNITLIFRTGQDLGGGQTLTFTLPGKNGLADRSIAMRM